MATSDSDDFESADEEIEFRQVSPKKSSKWTRGPTIGSDTDDDNECAPRAKVTSWSEEISDERYKNQTAVINEPSNVQSIPILKNIKTPITTESINSTESNGPSDLNIIEEIKAVDISAEETSVNLEKKSNIGRRERAPRQRKPKDSKSLSFGAKKLGSKIPTESVIKPPDNEVFTPSDVRRKTLQKNQDPPTTENFWEIDEDEAREVHECLKAYEKTTGKKINNKLSAVDFLDTEEMPEELKSNKKFKEVFSDGWEGLDDDGDSILSELENERVKPVLDDKLTTVSTVSKANASSWGSWGTWGVTSLLNTASVGVSTLSSHVSHGLSLLEESIGTPEITEPQTSLPEKANPVDDTSSNPQDNQSQGSFGFSNLISGVSTITKLVESTGTKVISGGLGTLETIGKKTMEVLQEGDPGLKKKRAFFMNEIEKPILSQILREAKEKAETEKKTVEEKQQARKIHFETLFDDFQGLVHLEALEMLSKQSNMKIQQKLVDLEVDEMMSIQETLDEVKELCDLGEEDEDEDNDNEDFKEKLNAACADLGVTISYDKLHELWNETKIYILNASESECEIVSDREILQNAISTLARFTAYCVERFHKTAELLLVKDRRSTVNEADSLVQLTKILSGQIGLVANRFAKCLNERSKKYNKPLESINMTTIFVEATNASSYVQDAFRLLIPILQVGAI